MTSPLDPSDERSLARRVLYLSPWLAVAAIVVLTLNAGAQTSQRVPELPATPLAYANPVLPAHFLAADVVAADNTPADNPVTDAGATLGRVLFYDTSLSANGSTSCASCHVQANSFSDPDVLSTGFEGGLTGRHSMSLANAAYYERGAFFWDERAATLEDQVLMPIQDSVEMGLSLSDMETKLAAIDYYPALFEDAFGTTDVTSDRVALALAQFVRSMVSANSRYDQGVASGFANFTAQEDHGRRLFDQMRCAACHETDLQILDRPRNIGLDATTTDDGAGNGRFKVPSLRNIEVTAPYMHDGRFATLEEVIDFYDSGVQVHPALAGQLDASDDPNVVIPRQLNMTQQEKDAMLAFLRTLTDDSFLSDERFSDPFVDVVVADGTCAGRTVTIDMNTNGGSGIGTAGDDVILGTPGPDYIDGGGGNDTICGQGGNDTILGGPGADTIHAGAGMDFILGGLDNDIVNGDGDADTIYILSGADTVNAGEGNDFVWGGPEGDTINGDGGNDYLLGNGGADAMDGGADDDLLFGGDGADTIGGGPGSNVLFGEAGGDVIEGGASSDTIFGGPDGDTITGNGGTDVMFGEEGADVITGGPDIDIIFGGIDGDTISGNGSGDLLFGEVGADSLSGGAGDDYMDGGDGADTLDGGTGSDFGVGGSGTDTCTDIAFPGSCEL